MATFVRSMIVLDTYNEIRPADTIFPDRGAKRLVSAGLISLLLPIRKRLTFSDQSLHILKVCEILLVLVRLCYENFLECFLTCTCRYRVSADDIFLKTFKVVYSASDRCLAENLCSLLE